MSAEDLAFYEKISPVFGGKKILISAPTLCPDCRQRRRITWRNERSLYRRKCSKTGKQIIAMYSPEAKFPVYDNEIWWSDKFDGREYAKDFDFSRGFFEQFMDLHDAVPHFALANAVTTMQNSDFCNHVGYIKDCYLIYNSDESERCMYSKGVNRCFDCLDCFKIYECEACYELLNSYNCKFCTYCWDMQNSSECHFSCNLIGCRDCFACINLQNKQYCFLNEQCTKEQYEAKVADLRAKLNNTDILKRFFDFRKGHVFKWIEERNTENCSGNYLVNCKNCEECFDCEYLENSKYCYDLKKGNGISFENYDLAAFGMGVTNCYEGSTIGYNANHVVFCENVWECSDMYYSMMCVNNCKDCFGCFGLKKAQYCILNKQYTKEQYEELVPRIIESMVKSAQWGEYFPEEFSPFAYSETMAQEYFPMSGDENKADYLSQTYKIPGKIEEVPDSICEEVLACNATGKNYKIQKAELDFYRKMKLPIPRFCPDFRHLERLKLRLPRKLWQRKCGNCEVAFKSPYSPDFQGKVFCRDCYLKAVF